MLGRPAQQHLPDVCTHLEDTLPITALYQCIIRILYRLRRDNPRWRLYANMLINENRWRAQRYGLDEGLLNFGKGQMVPSADLISELITIVAEDAEALTCTAEIECLHDIIEGGTSAHRQPAIYNQSLERGKSKQDALNDVVDMLIKETVSGI